MKTAPQSLVLLLAGNAISVAGHALGLRAAACPANNCNRAVTGTRKGDAFIATASSDCAAYLHTTYTATESPSTTVTVTVPATVTETNTATTQTTSTIVETSTAHATITVIPALVVPRAVSAGTVPVYASACNSDGAYSSACSCLGLSSSSTTVTVTLPTSTILSTVTTTNTAQETVTATDVSTTTTTGVLTETATVTGCNPLATPVIVNGGFESGTLSPWTVEPVGSDSEYGTYNVGPDAAGGDVTNAFHAHLGYPQQASYQKVFIKQQLTTCPGTTYSGSYQFRYARNGGSQPGYFYVYIGDDVVGGSGGESVSSYQSRTFTFTATGKSTTLAVGFILGTATSLDYQDMYVDNFVITPVV